MDPVGVVTELTRRFQAGDGAGALRLFHPDIHIEQPASLPHGGWHSGRDGVAAMGAIFSSLWERTIGQPRILGCGETVLTYASLRAFNRWLEEDWGYGAG